MTVTILIGNTDNKLTQVQWSHFTESIQQTLENISFRTYFSGGPHSFYPWQNACFVIEVPSEKLSALKD